MPKPETCRKRKLALRGVCVIASATLSGTCLLGCTALVDSPSARYQDRAFPSSLVEEESSVPDDFFGAAIALDDDELFVAAPGATITDIASSDEGRCHARTDADGAGRVYGYQRNGDRWPNLGELMRDSADDDEGTITVGGNGRVPRVSLARSGDTIAMGVPARDLNSCWSGPPPGTDQTISQAGAVYVFERDENGRFTRSATLISPHPETDGNFGVNLALRGDRLFVGSTGDSEPPPDKTEGDFAESGSVFVFAREGRDWRALPPLKAQNALASAYFGSALAVDGDTLAVGAWGDSHGEHGVSPEQPSQERIKNSGAVYVFRERDGVWQQEAFFKSWNPSPSEQWGFSVALERDTLLVGSPFEAGNQATARASEIDPRARVPALPDGTGAVHVFHRDGDRWTFDTLLKAAKPTPKAFFGFALGIYSGGAVVTAATEPLLNEKTATSDVGAAYFYERAHGSFVPRTVLRPSPTGPGRLFGFSTALNANRVAIGACGTAETIGYVRIFDTKALLRATATASE